AMTATLIAVLVQKKQMSFNRTLGQAFPQLAKKMPPELRAVTLTQLLSHRSGLKANLDNWWTVPGANPRQQRANVLELTLTQKPETKPGTTFLYPTLGYLVAGAMAERAANQPWEALLTRHVGKPLKMTTLGYGAAGTPGKVDQPWPHKDDGTPVEPGPSADNAPVLGPAGRAHCSLADWSRFVADHLKGASGKAGLLPAAAYPGLHAPAPPAAPHPPPRPTS